MLISYKKGDIVVLTNKYHTYLWHRRFIEAKIRCVAIITECNRKNIFRIKIINNNILSATRREWSVFQDEIEKKITYEEMIAYLIWNNYIIYNNLIDKYGIGVSNGGI